MRLIVVCLVTLVAVSVADAATPKPYQWTTKQAAQAVRSETQLVYTDESGLDMDLTQIACKGVGKAVQRRYLAFRCSATYTRPGTIVVPAETKRVVIQVKMRKVGRGSICANVGTVPLACLAKGTRAKGSMSSAYSAYRRKTQASPSDDECYAHGSGFYSCWYEDSTGRHTVTIIFAPSPVVKVLS